MRFLCAYFGEIKFARILIHDLPRVISPAIKHYQCKLPSKLVHISREIKTYKRMSHKLELLNTTNETSRPQIILHKFSLSPFLQTTIGLDSQ